MHNQWEIDRIEEIRNYIQEVGTVLQTRDVRQLRQFVIRHRDHFHPQMLETVLDDDTFLEIAMHQSICIRTDLADLHQESLTWLQSHGYQDPLEFHFLI